MSLKHESFVGKPQTILKFQNLHYSVFLKFLRNSYMFPRKTYVSITLTPTGGFIFAQEHESLPSKIGRDRIYAKVDDCKLLVFVTKITVSSMLEGVLDDSLICKQLFINNC